MTSGYYCAIFPFFGGEKKKDDKKTKAFHDWATTGIPVITKTIPRNGQWPQWHDVLGNYFKSSYCVCFIKLR